MMEPKEDIESIMNMTYPGLTMLYRDVNLGDLARKYTKGLILREKGFTDSSKRADGIITTHRFTILSNRYMDATDYEHDTNWGLCILQKDSHFKVLDVYIKSDKTQIILLHLPEKQWEFF